MIKSENLRDVALAALDEIKAIDVRVLDVRPLTDITDFMIIASGRSNRQVRALADEVVAEATRRGVRPLGVEGLDQGDMGAGRSRGCGGARDAARDPRLLPARTAVGRYRGGQRTGA